MPCSICSAGYGFELVSDFKTNPRCIPCASNCLNCDNYKAINCLTCMSGYSLLNNGSCVVKCNCPAPPICTTKEIVTESNQVGFIISVAFNGLFILIGLLSIAYYIWQSNNSKKEKIK